MEDKLYDLTSLKKIAGGNQDFISKMITLFSEITPKHVEEMKICLIENDFEAIGKIAHGMKPSIDQMGIKSLYQTIRDLEKNGKENTNTNQIPNLITEVENVINTVCQQLKST